MIDPLYLNRIQNVNIFIYYEIERLYPARHIFETNLRKLLLIRFIFNFRVTRSVDHIEYFMRGFSRKLRVQIYL